MKKFFGTFFLCLLAAVNLSGSALAAADTLKVGLCYGDGALDSAGLENYVGSGYFLGWFGEEDRDFHEVAALSDEKITVTASGWHVQLEEVCSDFAGAARAAARLSGGFPAYIDGQYRVRAGGFSSQKDAEAAARALGGRAVPPGGTGAEVAGETGRVLFAFDCAGERSLGVLPGAGEGKAQTRFNGLCWYGGFEFRGSGGKLEVVNVVPLDDYVRGVLPYEMSPVWPLEALKAQAVCARTYALLPSRHYAAHCFDVCNTTDCQVYRGTGLASELTDRAVAETAGTVALYGGKCAETYYCSSNGGASESSENVWSNPRPYLVGKEDPYEGLTDIPDYRYTFRYSFSQLAGLLRAGGYSIGAVRSAWVSRTTPTGNVAEITIRDSAGGTVKLTKEDCRWVLGARSMRFTLSGGGGWSVNPAGETLPALQGAYAVSGEGRTGLLGGGTAYAVTSSGVTALQSGSSSSDGITLTGTGWGHGVGMSQYGAKAMAELGFGCEDILRFYYTGVELGQIH